MTRVDLVRSLAMSELSTLPPRLLLTSMPPGQPMSAHALIFKVSEAHHRPRINHCAMTDLYNELTWIKAVELGTDHPVQIFAFGPFASNIHDHVTAHPAHGDGMLLALQGAEAFNPSSHDDSDTLLYIRMVVLPEDRVDGCQKKMLVLPPAAEDVLLEASPVKKTPSKENNTSTPPSSATKRSTRKGRTRAAAARIEVDSALLSDDATDSELVVDLNALDVTREPDPAPDQEMLDVTKSPRKQRRKSISPRKRIISSDDSDEDDPPPRLPPTPKKTPSKAPSKPSTPVPAPATAAMPPPPAVPSTSRQTPAVPSPSVIRRPEPKRKQSKSVVYTPLNECEETNNKKYNCWAAITSISKEPGPTKGRLFMARIYIQDETYVGSFGHPDYQFSLMGERIEHFPRLKVGSAIRIHHMVPQMYQGSLTGRVYDCRAVVVVHGSVGDPITPEYRSTNLEFTSKDEERVKELREWFAQKEAGQLEGQVPKEVLLEAVKGAMSLTLTVRVVAKIRTLDDGMCVVRVTDGTECGVPTVAYQKHGDQCTVEQLVVSDFARKEVDIFVHDHDIVLDTFKAGDAIRLEGIVAKPVRVPPHLTHMESRLFRLEIPRDRTAHATMLSEACGSYRFLMRCLKKANENPREQHTETLEMEELIAQINATGTTTGQTAGNFPDDSFNDIVADYSSGQLLNNDNSGNNARKAPPSPSRRKSASPRKHTPSPEKSVASSSSSSAKCSSTSSSSAASSTTTSSSNTTDRSRSKRKLTFDSGSSDTDNLRRSQRNNDSGPSDIHMFPANDVAINLESIPEDDDVSSVSSSVTTVASSGRTLRSRTRKKKIVLDDRVAAAVSSQGSATTEVEYATCPEKSSDESETVASNSPQFYTCRTADEEDMDVDSENLESLRLVLSPEK